jgi:hypothetical protein
MDTCCLCHSPISGDYWCVMVNRERHVIGGIDVLFSDLALAACMECMPAYDKRELVERAWQRVGRSRAECAP